jgi:hypothetical protein
LVPDRPISEPCGAAVSHGNKVGDEKVTIVDVIRTLENADQLDICDNLATTYESRFALSGRSFLLSTARIAWPFCT